MLVEAVRWALRWFIIDPAIGVVNALVLLLLAVPFRFVKQTRTPIVAVGIPGVMCLMYGMYHWRSDLEEIPHVMFEAWIAGLLAATFYFRRDFKKSSSAFQSEYVRTILGTVSMPATVLIVFFAAAGPSYAILAGESSRIHSWPLGARIAISTVFFCFYYGIGWGALSHLVVFACSTAGALATKPSKVNRQPPS